MIAMKGSKKDVIVIGGGVIGICVAYYAALQGASVLLIEKGDIGHGCTYGNAGLIVTSRCSPLPTPGIIAQGFKFLSDPKGPFCVRLRADGDLLKWIWKFYRFCNQKHFYHSVGILRKLALESLELHEEFARAGGNDYEFSKSGMISLYLNQKDFEEAQEEILRLESYGATSTVLSADEVRQLEPLVGPQIVGGLLTEEDGRLEPHAFVKWLAARSGELGVELLTDTEVLWLETDRRRAVEVISTRGGFRAEQFVLANGAWLPSLAKQLGAEIPIQAAKGYSLTFELPKMTPTRPFLLEEARIALTPFARKLRLSGTLELAGLDSRIERKRLKAIESRTYQYLPGLGELKIEEIWRGFRPCTPDGLPLMGRLQPWSNVLIAGGHGTKGMSLGPITGKYISRILAGKAIGMLEHSLRPQRF